MTEGTILKWLIGEGGECREGQPLFEMETDKLTITIDSPASGTLLKIVRAEGETVPITETIAIVGEKGEDISALSDDAGKNEAPPQPAGGENVAEKAEKQERAVPREPGARVFITPRAKTLALEKNIDYSTLPGSGPEGLITEKDVLACAAESPKATPLAKKIARDEGLALSGIQGSGERGKIVSGDVKAALKDRAAPSVQRKGRIVPFTGMRKVIASRMRESLGTNAQATHNVKVDMSEAVRMRENLKEAGKKVSFNDIVSYAVTKALLLHPEVNAELTDAGILEKDYVNLGIAVALDKGLVVPVVKDADLMTLSELSEAAKALAGKAKEGRLAPDDCTGGSFTVSNLGMLGLSEFVAIINPPESGILAVGKIEKQAVVVHDKIEIRPVMSLTLSYDHRVVDGAPAARFLVDVKAFLENPYLLL